MRTLHLKRDGAVRRVAAVQSPHLDLLERRVEPGRLATNNHFFGQVRHVATLAAVQLTLALVAASAAFKSAARPPRALREGHVAEYTRVSGAEAVCGAPIGADAWLIRPQLGALARVRRVDFIDDGRAI